MGSVDEALRQLVREEVSAALEDAEPRTPVSEADDSWRSRLWTVDAECRLTLAEAAEALGCSERSVRRYCGGESDTYPTLPSRRGPTGVTVRAGDLRAWLADVEDAARFRCQRGGAA